MNVTCVLLSTHLHDPCLCGRGHDPSTEDNIVRLWLLGSRMTSSPLLAKSEATAQAIVSARYTCRGPCTRKVARKFPLYIPPPSLPCCFEPSIYHRVVVGSPV